MKFVYSKKPFKDSKKEHEPEGAMEGREWVDSGEILFYQCLLYESCMSYICFIYMLSILYLCFIYALTMLYVYFIYILTILHLCYISVSLVNGGRREGKGREEMKEHWGGDEEMEQEGFRE